MTFSVFFFFFWFLFSVLLLYLLVIIAWFDFSVLIWRGISNCHRYVIYSGFTLFASVLWVCSFGCLKHEHFKVVFWVLWFHCGAPFIKYEGFNFGGSSVVLCASLSSVLYYSLMWLLCFVIGFQGAASYRFSWFWFCSWNNYSFKIGFHFFSTAIYYMLIEFDYPFLDV